MAGSDAEHIFWHYNPSLIASITATIVFGILTILHIFRFIKTRSKICVPFIFGALNEAIGYAARGIAHNNTDANFPYLVQSIMILIAPIMIAASIYIILGRVIMMVNAGHHSPIQPKSLGRIFGIGDVITFLMQCTGGVLVARKVETETGEQVILGGLGVQMFLFGFFTVVAVVWHRRVLKSPTPECKPLDGKLWMHMWLLYLVAACITVRNGCRCVEYAMGPEGYLLRHEWPLYLYDFVLMTITLVICLMWYEEKFEGQDREGFEGIVELESAGERREGRPWV
ncbi:RTA1 like protein [Zopfia rhizophila CBS 207.26]|uniref:RTA1 like protein n=1 Tax=Zopfia rhizophila CBS 207.26 TaxID=1314779 RepID=A0A6A6DEW1_9PEZI|nr:RTA1 like protein [Zopfia rhizophila CBS 207.26]